MSHPLPSNENLHETPDAHYHYDNPALTNVELTTDAPPGGSPQRPPRRSHAPPPDDAAVGSKDPRPDYRESLPHYTGGVIDSKPHDSRDSYALTVDGKTSAGDVVPPPDPTPGVIERCFDGVTSLYAKHRRSIGIIVRVTALLLYAVYFFAAVAYAVRTSVRPLGVWPKGIKELIGVTCCVVAMAIYFRLKPIVAPHAEKVATPVGERLQRYWPWLKWVCYSVIVVAIVLILFAGLELHKTPSNLISAVGLLCLCLFCFVFSMHPTRVNWRPILWGLALQFIFGLLILRTSVGRQVFTWLGDKVTIFLNFTDAGAKFVLGQYEIDQCGNVVQVLKIFAFSVLPVIVFFSSVISVLYYLGVMQAVIQRVAWLMQFTMKTTAAESLNAAGNIFIGQSESPLMIKPYIKDMTKSELHAIMTGGFATVAGSVLGAYIKFNVSASHLLSASVMSAPAALAISKLFYPETEPSKTMTAEDVTLPKGKEVNVVEAAANGASTSIKLVANIAVNLIAFLAFLALINALLSWFGSLLGHPEVTFEFICSYVFMPLAFIMGVPWQDCRKVAELIGVKTFLNEFIAYERLGRYVINGELTARSEVIATYALCGFSNIGSVGIMIGTLGAMAPSRKSDLAEIAVRALVAGTVACFMTACIAGLLIDDPSTIGRASSSFTVNGTQVECP